MDRQTKKIYQRGALFVVPALAIVACRVGPRACIALMKADRANDATQRSARTWEDEEADRIRAQREAENAAAALRQRQRAKQIPTANPGFKTSAVASAQQMPDGLVLDAKNVAWASTHSGEVVVAPRDGGAPRVVAKGQKIPQKRHGQALAMSADHVYWITTAGDDDGAVMRAPLAGGEPEVVADKQGGLTAVAVDKDNVYFARSPRVSRDDDDEPLGGVYKLPLGKKEPERLLAAEQPCALAVDESSVYAVDALQIWRAPKNAPAKKPPAPKKLVSGAERIGCSIAVDKQSIYWTLPAGDTLMRAKKADGASPSALAFPKTRPTNVAVDGAYAYVLTESSPQALGELGNVFRVALRAEPGSEAALPKAVVTDQIGLNSLATHDGHTVFSAYNEAENDGTVTLVSEDALR